MRKRRMRTENKRVVTAPVQVRHVKKIRIHNSGYGNYGANKKKNSTAGWNSSGGDVIKDINLNLSTLRERGRDLFMGSPIATGAIKTTATNTVGAGLRLKPRINKKILGLSEEQGSELEEQISNEFNMWANSKVDVLGLLDFYSLQELAFLSVLLSGEVFVLLPFIETQDNNPYGLKIQLVEADRICNERNKKNTDEMIDGVILDKNGRIKAYQVADKHPLGQKTNYEVKKIDVHSKTGKRNIIHLLGVERPGQLRGVPFLSPVIEKLKQLDRYTDAELMAAVVSGLFTVFIENEKIQTNDSLKNLSNINEEDRQDEHENNIELGNGAVWELEEGQKIKETNPGRPNTAFDGFTSSIIDQIGTALEIPHEVLVKHFGTSYSASRAALQEAWRMFKKRREWFAKGFCQVIYSEWLTDAVLRGRVNLPKFFEDPIYRYAYLQTEWIGPAVGQLDPLKEVSAAAKRIEIGISTRDKEALEINGSDAEINIKQNIKDELLIKEGSESE